MKQLTQTGASVEEAIAIALQKLGCSRDEVQVEVLQEEKKGFLGFGSRLAEVKITVLKEEEEVQEEKKIQLEDEKIEVEEVKVEEQSQQVEVNEQDVNVDPVEVAKNYLNDIAKTLNIHDLTFDCKVDGKYIYINMESKKAALLIGKRGATLNALQHLTQLVINKATHSYKIVSLDVENYRERRHASLEQLAEKMADKAIHTGKKVILEPMPSYERKIIHNALANRIDIETYSEGVEPNRYLIIEPIK